MKKLGRASLKKHYAIFVAACLIASFIGAECAVLMIAFAADAAYSHFYPNTGEGITDYGQAEVQETGSQQDAAVN